MSSVAVPNAFLCPIRYEIMIEPVKTDCTELSMFQRIYNAIFVKQGFEGHVFEKLALTVWLNENSTCPVCRRKVNKVFFDKKMATKITQQFINVSEVNKTYFEKVKKDLDEDLTYLDIIEKNILTSFSNFDLIKEYLNGVFTHPKQVFKEIFYPASEINFYINNDNLERAEKITNRGFNRFSDPFSHKKNDFYRKIAQAYLNRSYSEMNLIKALRILYKVSYWSEETEKNNFFEEICCIAIRFDRLDIAEYSAEKISAYSDLAKREKCFHSIAKSYINKRFSDDSLNKAKIIATHKLEFVSNKTEILNLIALAYAKNNKYKDGFEVANSIANPVSRWLTYLRILFEKI